MSHPKSWDDSYYHSLCSGGSVGHFKTFNIFLSHRDCFFYFPNTVRQPVTS